MLLFKQPNLDLFFYLTGKRANQFTRLKKNQSRLQSELEGEKPSPTQPIPTLPKPFVRQVLNEDDLNNLVPDSSYNDLKKRLASYKTGNMFNPPSKEGTVIFPGFDGGGEWGGPAFDPSTGILYVNASEMPWILTMIDVKNDEKNNETYLQAGQAFIHATLCCMSWT